MSKVIDLKGQKFNKLLVLELDHCNKNGAYWKCLCDCGKTKVIDAHSLKRHMTKSCGCLHTEQSKNLCIKRNTSHGLSQSSDLYGVWKTMRQRCNNAKSYDYRWYGGIGISICDEWSDYKKFLQWAENSGYTKGLTIDRIDETKNYCQENCQWITIQEQQRKKKSTKKVEFNGKTYTFSELSKITGIKHSTLADRISHGWTIEQAVKTPIIKGGTKMKNKFNASKVKKDIVEWIREWFKNNGENCKACVAVSGGKDSSVVAALCVEALGKERVFGVLMPQNIQPDIDCSLKLVKHLGIYFQVINIGETVEQLFRDMRRFNINDGNAPMFISDIAKVNTPARVRMTTLYAVAGCLNGRVANTCNKSEDYVGYSTKFGDSAGDFSPLANLTVTEVKQLGYELGLPVDLIEKVPQDGLCGKSDEDNLGFTYEVLDKYIQTGICDNLETKIKIDKMHKANLHKLRFMDCFPN